MRLIDADKLLDWYDRQGWDGVQAVVDMQPTIDAVPVVRCKDCKHQESCTRLVTEVIYDPVLKENVCYHYQMEYCSSGERRTTDENQ